MNRPDARRARLASLALVIVLGPLACGDDKSTPAATDTFVDDTQDTAPTEVVFQDTGTVQDTGGPEADVTPGGFGAACQQNADCLDGYCVEGPEGFVCTRLCESECPEGYDCRGVTSGSADLVFLCLPRVAKVCVPCKADYQCTGGVCMQIAGSGQCATACDEEADCFAGYTCKEDATAAHAGTYCQPKSGSCDCTPDFTDAVRTCVNENSVGSCYGIETCDPDVGWQGCTAAIATEEICDGRDNDCNALVDDGLTSDEPCENTTPGVGTCSGVRVCVGTQGYVCTALVPAPETCDFIDNDCDGDTDNVPGRGEPCVNTTDAGSCPGINICQDGALVCLGQTPSDEVCNFEDDDCDGQTDEDFPGIYDSCSVGTGQCRRFGTVLCTDDGSGADCNAVAAASSPERCDGLDNDCDGDSDEDFPSVGEVCSDGVGVCTGFGTRSCTADGLGVVCTAVATAPGDELCDLLDNDCDGQTDEAFKNAAGRYSLDTTCGNCFTDCTLIFDKPNAFGICDAAPALPACKMQCDPGYYDLNEVPDDGCEFFLDGDAIYVSGSDAASIDGSDCGGGPAATGGGRRPCRTIGFALFRATTLGKSKVFVTGTAYNENVLLRDGVSLYGGYDPLTWVRDPTAFVSALFSTQGEGHRKTVTADGIKTKATVFDGFTVYGQTANGFGENSYAIWVNDSNEMLQISNNTVWPGSGGPGQPGNHGNAGADGIDGQGGSTARETNVNPTFCYKTCSGTNAGGLGGVNSACGVGTRGGDGGTARCPDYNENVDFCVDSAFYTAVQTNNHGGADGDGSGGGDGGVGGCDQQQGPSCTCFVPGTVTNCPNGNFALPGENGSSGVAGQRGSAAGNPSGSVIGGEWRGSSGNDGVAGVSGAGGGGGGAGGGVESHSNCEDDGDDGGNDFGGSGGGGGSGGCGGTGGKGGGPGGGSFGIFVAASGGSAPLIFDNDLHIGFGGTGGRGGDGGTAGLGGLGGLGGDAAPGTSSWCAKPGGQGGRGGDGGPGGGGAGGNGGAAFGLFASGPTRPDWVTQNAYYLDGLAGAGGTGGGTGAGGNAGAQGQTGTILRHNL